MSAPQLTPELLAEPAPRAAREIARGRLEAVATARLRLGSDDPQALHDVRVALRRLRSWLQAYRPVLDDTVARKSRRTFTKLARATNAARDAEVALTWLETQGDLPPAAARGHRELVDRVIGERMQTAHAVDEFLAARLPRAVRKLERQLGSYWLRVPVDGAVREPAMHQLTAKLLRSHAKRFARLLRRARAAHDVGAAHRARIAAKRLRYLLEPLDADARAADLIARLSTLQDRLGEFHDAQLLAERILHDVEDIASLNARRRAIVAVEPDLAPRAVPRGESRRGQRAGLLEVARRAHRDANRAFAAYRKAWPRRALDAALRDAVAIADALAGLASPE
jgi:CHAD domain-containing protein